MTVDFGFVPSLSVGSTVFYDPNNNGVQDLANPLEDGISGVTVQLFYDADGNGSAETLVSTTVTECQRRLLFRQPDPGQLPGGDPRARCLGAGSSNGPEHRRCNDDETTTAHKPVRATRPAAPWSTSPPRQNQDAKRNRQGRYPGRRRGHQRQHDRGLWLHPDDEPRFHGVRRREQRRGTKPDQPAGRRHPRRDGAICTTMP